MGIQNEILLQLALVSNPDGSEIDAVKKAVRAYLKKLGCFAGAIVKSEGSDRSIKHIEPRSLLRSDFNRVVTERLISSDKPHEPIRVKRGPNYYYGFKLDHYGVMILGRREPFDRDFEKDLGIVVGNLGRALNHAALIEENENTQRHLVKNEMMLRGLAAAANELLNTDDFPNSMNRALEIIGKASGVDRTYLFTVDEENGNFKESVSQRFEWNSGDSEPQIDNPDLQNLPFDSAGDSVRKLEQNELFEAIVSQLPNTSGTRKYLEDQDIKSVLMIPVFLKQRFWGFIGFDDCKRERFWTQTEKSLLMSFSAGISKAEENRRSKKELKERNRLLKTVTENARDIIGLVDFPERFHYISPSVENILGYTPGEVYDIPFRRFINDEKALKNVMRILKIPESGSDQNIKKVITHQVEDSRGHTVWLETSMVVMPDSGYLGNLPVQIVSRDITARKRLEEEREKTNKRERELVDLRRVFVSMASHQFRTPLTIIQSNIDLINVTLKRIESEKTGVPDLIDKATKRIKRQIEMMAGLMNDILILGKVGDKGLKPDIKPIKPVKLLRECADDFNEGSGKGRVHVSAREEDIVVNADKQLILHAVTNLIENALKYSPESEPVNVIIRKSKKKGEVEISVEDRGIGIAEEDLKNITDTFYRGKNVSDIHGTGLGLSIVREFTNVHGGRFEIRSKLNKGTTAEIALPIHALK